MRRLLILPFASLLLACGGDYTAAQFDVQFTPYEDPELEKALDEPLDEPTNPLVEPPATPPVEPPEEKPPEEKPPEEPPIEPEEPPIVTPEEPEQPPETPPEEPPEPDYDPDWTENEDPAVQGCLEAFPAICNKAAECGADQPVVQLLGGFCPVIFDSLSPILEQSCEDIHAQLSAVLPDVQIPLVGDLQTMLSNLITGCIENFQCDPAYLQELGAKFAEVLGAFGGAAGGGGAGGDIGAALPALLELANMCGGIGGLLPF